MRMSPCRGYLELTEAALEDTFAEYQQRQGQRASAARRKRRRLGQATELDGTGSASEDDDALAADGHRGFAAAPAADDDEALLRLDLAVRAAHGQCIIHCITSILVPHP